VSSLFVGLFIVSLVQIVVFLRLVEALLLLHGVHQFVHALKLQVAPFSLRLGSKGRYEAGNLEKALALRKRLVESLFDETQRKLLLPQVH
jgi:hypothetical protein